MGVFLESSLSRTGVFAALTALPSVLSFRPKPSIIIRVVGVFISIVSPGAELPTIALFLICGVDDGDELIGLQGCAADETAVDIRLPEAPQRCLDSWSRRTGW